MLPLDQTRLRPAERCLCEVSQYFGLNQNYRRDARGIVLGTRGTFSLWVRPGTAPGDGQSHTYLWVNPWTANPLTGIFVTKDGSSNLTLLMVNDGGPLLIQAPVSAATFPQNVCHHLGVRYSAAQADIWLNGVQWATGVPALGNEVLSAGAQYALGYSGLIFPDSAMADIRNPYYWDQVLEDEMMVWLHRNRVGA